MTSRDVPGENYGLLTRGSPRKFKEEYLGMVGDWDSFELGQQVPKGLLLGLVMVFGGGTAQRFGILEDLCGGCREMGLTC